MIALDLTTPTLLFSAISLILLAYTNRFLSYAAVIRDLKNKTGGKDHNEIAAQISNLHKRLHLVRLMQVLGVSSFFCCVVTMILLYFRLSLWAELLFLCALLLLSASLGVCLWEINISVKALEINLGKISIPEQSLFKQKEMKNER